MYQILTRWERFETRIKQRQGTGSNAPAAFIIDEEFPFHKFFDNAPKPLFKRNSYEEDLEIACSCFR